MDRGTYRFESGMGWAEGRQGNAGNGGRIVMRIGDG